MLEHKHGFKLRQIEAEKEAFVQVQSTKTDRKHFDSRKLMLKTKIFWFYFPGRAKLEALYRTCLPPGQKVLGSIPPAAAPRSLKCGLPSCLACLDSVIKK